MSQALIADRVIQGVMLFGIGFLLASCGNRPGERALSGGLIGAGTGAAIGAVTGGSPATGALIGGGVGALGGAVTSPRGIR
jgi:osmotically inducible lipoprotein OsmB